MTATQTETRLSYPRVSLSERIDHFGAKFAGTVLALYGVAVVIEIISTYVLN